MSGLGASPQKSLRPLLTKTYSNGGYGYVHCYGAAYGNGKYVVLAKQSAGNVAMASQDAITWTPVGPTDTTVWKDIVFTGGEFVAVGDGGTGTKVMTSVDGSTWSRVGPTSEGGWLCVGYGNGRLVALRSSSAGNGAMYSLNTTGWTIASGVPNGTWNDVVYGAGLFVAVGSSGPASQRVITSPDGATWTARSSSNDLWSSIAYGNGVFVAVGRKAAEGTTNSGYNVMTSSDGITWTNRGEPITTQGGTPPKVCWTGKFFFACGSTAGHYSYDGITWYSVPGLFTNNEGSIALAVGVNGFIQAQSELTTYTHSVYRNF